MQAWQSEYPYHSGHWIYYPAKWWHIKNRGGEWRITLYDTTHPPKDWTTSIYALIDRIKDAVYAGDANYLDWEEVKNCQTVKWTPRCTMVYSFKFKRGGDAVQFRLTFLDA